MNNFLKLFSVFYQTDFIQENKYRLFTMLGFTGTGVAPEIEPTKTIINLITIRQVTEVFQMLSFIVSFLVGLTILYKFLKSLKKE